MIIILVWHSWQNSDEYQPCLASPVEGCFRLTTTSHVKMDWNVSTFVIFLTKTCACHSLLNVALWCVSHYPRVTILMFRKMQLVFTTSHAHTHEWGTQLCTHAWTCAWKWIRIIMPISTSAIKTFANLTATCYRKGLMHNWCRNLELWQQLAAY